MARFGRTYTNVIQWRGDPNAAPATPAGGPVPTQLVVQAANPRPFKGQAILGAAPADIYFNGPVVATPLPTKPTKNTSIIRSPLGPFFGEAPPPPFVITRQPLRPTTSVLTWHQMQDG